MTDEIRVWRFSKAALLLATNIQSDDITIREFVVKTSVVSLAFSQSAGLKSLLQTLFFVAFLILRSSATEPTENVKISLHFLEFLLMLLGCSVVPLTVTFEFFAVLNFGVKLANNLLLLENFGCWGRFWDNVLQLVGQHDCLGATVANIGCNDFKLTQ